MGLKRVCIRMSVVLLIHFCLYGLSALFMPEPLTESLAVLALLLASAYLFQVYRILPEAIDTRYSYILLAAYSPPRICLGHSASAPLPKTRKSRSKWTCRFRWAATSCRAIWRGGLYPPASSAVCLFKAGRSRRKSHIDSHAAQIYNGNKYRQPLPVLRHCQKADRS